MECVLFIGLQASGKSSFYKERFFHSHLRINLDMLNRRSREERLIQACLETQQAFVVDNTNLTRASRFHYIQQAKAYQFKVIGYYFRADTKQSLMLNQERSGKARVPDAAILGAYKKLQLPDWEEGFDNLFYVNLDDSRQFVVKVWHDEI